MENKIKVQFRTNWQTANCDIPNRCCCYVQAKDGNFYFMEFSAYTKRLVRKTNKRNGKELKHPIIETLGDDFLIVRTQFNKVEINKYFGLSGEHGHAAWLGSYGNCNLEEKIDGMGLKYSKSTVLYIINMISGKNYTDFEIVNELEEPTEKKQKEMQMLENARFTNCENVICHAVEQLQKYKSSELAQYRKVLINDTKNKIEKECKITSEQKAKANAIIKSININREKSIFDDSNIYMLFNDNGYELVYIYSLSQSRFIKIDITNSSMAGYRLSAFGACGDLEQLDA